MKKLTKDEAREFLKGRWVNVPTHYAGRVQDIALSAGFTVFGFRHCVFENLCFDEQQAHWEDVVQDGYSVLPLSELLSLEITEEPESYKAKFEEALEHIAKMVHANENLPNIAQLIQGWKATTPENEWSDFDQDCVDWLAYIQQVNGELKSKYTYEVGDNKR